jgi:uncharacterized lipoprotein YmbA
MPETKIYSLNMPDTSSSSYSKSEKERLSDVTNVKAGSSIMIRVSSPRYLSQAYMAYRSSPYQLEVSRYSKWESPPNLMLKEAFRDSLSSAGLFKEVRAANAVSEGFYLLDINLKRFERYDDGNDSFADLVFDVNLVSPDGMELYRSTVSKKVKLDERSFLSLARGLSGALTEGIGEVRKNIIIQINQQTLKDRT